MLRPPTHRSMSSAPAGTSVAAAAAVLGAVALAAGCGSSTTKTSAALPATRPATYNYATVDSITAIMRTKMNQSIATTPGARLHIAAVACLGPYGPEYGLAVTFTCHETLTAQDGSTAAKRGQVIRAYSDGSLVVTEQATPSYHRATR